LFTFAELPAPYEKHAVADPEVTVSLSVSVPDATDCFAFDSSELNRAKVPPTVNELIAPITIIVAKTFFSSQVDEVRPEQPRTRRYVRPVITDPCAR